MNDFGYSLNKISWSLEQWHFVIRWFKTTFINLSYFSSLSNFFTTITNSTLNNKSSLIFSQTLFGSHLMDSVITYPPSIMDCIDDILALILLRYLRNICLCISFLIVRSKLRYCFLRQFLDDRDQAHLSKSHYGLTKRNMALTTISRLKMDDIYMSYLTFSLQVRVK